MNEVFQEKHTSGHLWWKKTYYIYWRYFEGSMHQLSLYSVAIRDALETK